MLDMWAVLRFGFSRFAPGKFRSVAWGFCSGVSARRFLCCWQVGSSASLSSSSVSAFCEVVFVVERSPGFLPFPCLASRIGRGFALGSREVIDFFYRFVHGGPMAVWLSSFCDSMSATSSRMVGLSSMAFSNFRFGGCSLFVVVSHLLCPAVSASSEVASSQSFFVGHSSLSSSPAFSDEAQWRPELGSLPSGQDVDLKCRTLLFSIAGSGVRYGWCLFAACFVRIRCSGLQVVRVLDLCFPWRLVMFARPWLCWCLAAERIIGQANFYRVPTLDFTVASTSAASRLFRLGEASGLKFTYLLKMLSTIPFKNNRTLHGLLHEFLITAGSERTCSSPTSLTRITVLNKNKGFVWDS
ncbi:hypothetical protein IGI04_013039 [Brassica rapa subsp. trilocularis]|uniref:Uncharacterized protein n=2 Tax=Brassica campestris TaxID=3711 RepID=M4DS65_BRACM|nr:hypothetical protein IGI04_013039 [Brassica rapa subsp. trilocularis]